MPQAGLPAQRSRIARRAAALLAPPVRPGPGDHRGALQHGRRPRADRRDRHRRTHLRLRGTRRRGTRPRRHRTDRAREPRAFRSARRPRRPLGGQPVQGAREYRRIRRGGRRADRRAEIHGPRAGALHRGTLPRQHRRGRRRSGRRARRTRPTDPPVVECRAVHRRAARTRHGSRRFAGHPDRAGHRAGRDPRRIRGRGHAPARLQRGRHPVARGARGHRAVAFLPDQRAHRATAARHRRGTRRSPRDRRADPRSDPRCRDITRPPPRPPASANPRSRTDWPHWHESSTKPSATR